MQSSLFKKKDGKNIKLEIPSPITIRIEKIKVDKDRPDRKNEKGKDLT